MLPQAVLTAVTAAAGDLANLANRDAIDFRDQFQSGADGRGIRTPASALNHEPSIRISSVAIEEVILVVEIRDEEIEETVLIVVGPGTAITRGIIVDQRTSNDPGECSVTIVPEEEVPGSCAVRLAFGAEQVQDTVIVI